MCSAGARPVRLAETTRGPTPGTLRLRRPGDIAAQPRVRPLVAIERPPGHATRLRSMEAHGNGSGGVAFMINLDSGEVAPMEEMTLASAGLQERADLQRWITAHPELIAPDLVLITT